MIQELLDFICILHLENVMLLKKKNKKQVENYFPNYLLTKIYTDCKIEHFFENSEFQK